VCSQSALNAIDTLHDYCIVTHAKINHMTLTGRTLMPQTGRLRILAFPGRGPASYAPTDVPAGTSGPHASLWASREPALESADYR
jgi:hypothetical protein